jgi:hypothetical protein
MPEKITRLLSIKARPIAALGCAVGLFFICFNLEALNKNEQLRPRFPEKISQKEGREFIEEFRAQRLQGDYCFKFLLEHLPRRGATVRYQGTLWGSWNSRGPVSRFVLESVSQAETSEAVEKLEWIIQNGRDPEVWSRKSRDEEFVLLDSEAMWNPLFEGVLYRPFDLLMPFVYWEQWEYKGPKTIGSRLAQQFLMLPPEPSKAPGISGVRMALDNDYKALLSIEILDTNEKALTRFEVESFKKVEEQYIVKRITLGEEKSGDRTRFRVIAASVGLHFLEPIFDAKNRSTAVVPPKEFFTEF